MKIRNGFVSNSSSASFIIHWRHKGMGNKISVKEAVARIFGVDYYFDKVTEMVDWTQAWNKEAEEKYNNVVEYTENNNDGSYTTTFFTAMMNSADDFGDSARSMLIGLVTNGEFQIVDTCVNKDD